MGLNAALKNVITDDQLTPRGMLTLAQAMRDLNTRTVATYTIESYPKRIGEMSVLIPSIKSETMQQILAIFQGKTSLTVQGAAMHKTEDLKIQLISQRTLSDKTMSPTTTIPSTTPSQKTVGVVPPNDPACR
ncbi:MAG: hypothetical protein NTY54_01270 [Actinobacteria bacterium]|nr:hypothetical protein [Actinomycetota bacterium]